MTRNFFFPLKVLKVTKLHFLSIISLNIFCLMWTKQFQFLGNKDFCSNLCIFMFYNYKKIPLKARKYKFRGPGKYEAIQQYTPSVPLSLPQLLFWVVPLILHRFLVWKWTLVHFFNLIHTIQLSFNIIHAIHIYLF